jgi:hypothetical protein
MSYGWQREFAFGMTLSTEAFLTAVPHMRDSVGGSVGGALPCVA